MKKTIFWIIVLLILSTLCYKLATDFLKKKDLESRSDLSKYTYEYVIPDNPFMSEKEKTLFLNLPSSATTSKVFFETAAEVAVDVSYVEVNNECNLFPVTSHVTKGSTLAFKNTSESTVEIQIGGKTIIIAPGGLMETAPFTWNSSARKRVYAILCQGSTSPSGFVYASY